MKFLGWNLKKRPWKVGVYKNFHGDIIGHAYEDYRSNLPRKLNDSIANKANLTVDHVDNFVFELTFIMFDCTYDDNLHVLDIESGMIFQIFGKREYRQNFLSSLFKIETEVIEGDFSSVQNFWNNDKIYQAYKPYRNDATIFEAIKDKDIGFHRAFKGQFTLIHKGNVILPFINDINYPNYN